MGEAPGLWACNISTLTGAKVGKVTCNLIWVTEPRTGKSQTPSFPIFPGNWYLNRCATSPVAFPPVGCSFLSLVQLPQDKHRKETRAPLCHGHLYPTLLCPSGWCPPVGLAVPAAVPPAPSTPLSATSNIAPFNESGPPTTCLGHDSIVRIDMSLFQLLSCLLCV